MAWIASCQAWESHPYADLDILGYVWNVWIILDHKISQAVLLSKPWDYMAWTASCWAWESPPYEDLDHKLCWLRSFA
jgi:hypothetical protein